MRIAEWKIELARLHRLYYIEEQAPLPKYVSFNRGLDIKDILTMWLEEMLHIGFIPSEKLWVHLNNNQDIKRLVVTCREILEIAKSIKGVRNYRPMYPNFPAQVEQMTEAEWLTNALIHYYTNGEFLPHYPKEKRAAFFSKTKPGEIDGCTKKNLVELMTQYGEMSQAFNASQKCLVSGLLKLLGKSSLPKNILYRENFIFIVLAHWQTYHSEFELKYQMKSSTDVLRLAVGLSDGDISLSQPSYFKKFSRAERRLLLALLDSQKNAKEDMQRYKEMWKRLGQAIHPKDYQKRYSKAYDSFRALWEKEKVETFNGKLEQALANYDIDAALCLLQQRPGEFARRLNQLLSITALYGEEVLSYQIIHRFKQVMDQVSTYVLLNVRHYFAERNDLSDARIFFPKGVVGKMFVSNDQRLILSEKICQKLVQICEEELLVRFGKEDYLGRVYLSPTLKGYTLPHGTRSASKALKLIGKGSRIKLTPTTQQNIYRVFIHWKGKEIDVDSSVTLYNEDWQNIDYCTYYQLKSGHNTMVHSGDIVSAPNGASEFIDIDRKKALAQGARYAMFTINSYSQIPFRDMSVCQAGIMVREDGKKGKVYEAKSVEQFFDISGEHLIAIPFMLDLETMEMIWADMSLQHIPNIRIPNNIHAHVLGAASIGYGIVHQSKPNLYDLYRLHAQARGELVFDEYTADVIFSDGEESVVSCSNHLKILSEYVKD